MKRLLRRATVLGAAAGLGLVLMAPSAQAVLPADSTLTPFDPARPQVFITTGANNGPTQLTVGVGGSVESTSFSEDGTPTPGVVYNAVAFNPDDGYIYGVASSDGGGFVTGELVRVGQGNQVENAGDNFGPARNAGAFADVGHGNRYYVFDGNNETTVVGVDVTTGSADPAATITLDAVPGISDFTLVGGYFWGVENFSRNLVRIDPATGTVTNFPNVLPNGPAQYVAGGVWTYGNGSLGIKDNASGTIVEVVIANAGAATPTFAIAGTQAFDGADKSDATAIPGFPADLALSKTVSPTTYAAGDTLTFTLTVTNLGAGWSSGHTVTDTLPGSLTSIASPTAGCSVAGQTVTCVGGELEPTGPNNTAVYTVTAVVAAGATGDIANAAEVAGSPADPADPDLTNNTASVTLSPALVDPVVPVDPVTPASTGTLPATGAPASLATLVAALAAVALGSAAVVVGRRRATT